MDKNDKIMEIATLIDLIVKLNSLISVLKEKQIINDEDLDAKYKLVAKEIEEQIKRRQ